MKHILSILMENEAGAMSRIVGLFSARGYNINSLSVAPTEDASLSRMTITTYSSDEGTIEQIVKQLNKLIEVIKVCDLTGHSLVERELMLVKLQANHKDRANIIQLAEIFRAHIIDISDKTITIELTGTSEKLDAFLKAIGHSLILETARTGVTGLSRGEHTLRI
ncbi:acetolactate synthase small subunit [Neisseriaceae bacterium ESL0693]|nr:acetolactate synthase small subunit [Neisseriaceae bacterium ESL0693]